MHSPTNLPARHRPWQVRRAMHRYSAVRLLHFRFNLLTPVHNLGGKCFRMTYRYSREGIRLISKIKEELLFAKAILTDNPRVQEDILEDNRKAAIFWAVIQIVFWSLSLVVSRFNQEYIDCLPVYIIAIAISVASLICAIFICRKHLRLVPLVALALNVALLGAGLGITLVKGDLRSAVVFCTLLIVPVCYITDTLSTILLFLIDFLALMVIGPHTMDPDIFAWTRSFFILFGVIGILMGHFINKTRFERYVYADAAEQYAELQTRYAYYDQMTGLKNRRAYAEKAEELTKKSR